MRCLPLVLLAGCMTDPNGNTCAWSPGNDGFCPSDSGSSKQPHKTSYHSGAGVVEGDHIRIAMTRSETGERPYLETAVFTGVEPEHTAVLLDGEPMPGTVVPQLAAIDDLVYLAWADQYANVMVVAPLYSDGTVIAEEIVNLGTRTGMLRRLGDRLLFVFAKDTEIRGTWIDRDGRLGDTIVLATSATTSSGIDVSNDGASGTLAIAYHTYDKPTEARGVVIARVAADGSHRDTTIPVGKNEYVEYAQAVTTSDGGAVVALGTRAPSIARIEPDGTFRVQPTKLETVADLVRNGSTILAVSTVTKTTTFALDERGTILSGPFALDATPGARVFPTSAGFTALHATPEAGVVLTPLDASAYPGASVVIGETTEEGCGCRTTNGHTAGLFVIVFALVLRRRVRRAA